MGSTAFTRTAYAASYHAYVPSTGPATHRAEVQAKKTGKLHALVDPAEYGVIRPSRMRMDQREDGLWVVNVGTPMPVEVRVDTTGSMGGNVDIALRVLPDTFEMTQQVLRPDMDLFMAIGIFGDVCDDFALCRPQFEAEAGKIVEQLTLMVPERGGGDFEEDPHYGLFGAAYLTDAYINRVGLKRYDFTVSDAPARDRLSERQLVRIFGANVFDKVAENGWQISKSDLPSTKEVVRDLLEKAHAFFLQVGDDSQTRRFWTNVFGVDRVVTLPSTELLPHVQSTIIGLTEGTLTLDEAAAFLQRNNVPTRDAERILRSVANIPIGAQPVVEGLPRPGDLFQNKTDTWPIGHGDTQPAVEVTYDDESDGPGWL